jgi:hypothetical protein
MSAAVCTLLAVTVLSMQQAHRQWLVSQMLCCGCSRDEIEAVACANQHMIQQRAPVSEWHCSVVACCARCAAVPAWQPRPQARSAGAAGHFAALQVYLHGLGTHRRLLLRQHYIHVMRCVLLQSGFRLHGWVQDKYPKIRIGSEALRFTQSSHSSYDVKQPQC